MKLNKHLLLKTNQVALSENIVFFNDYRISVLTNQLFRIERSSKKEFVDKASIAIINRNINNVSFNIIINDIFVEIKTNKVTLHIENDFTKNYVLLNNKKVKIDNSENLKSTACGLDGFDGDSINVYTNKNEKIILENGVCSKNGVAFIDDSNNQLLTDEGLIVDRNNDEIDIYVFAYGNNYQEAVKDFYKISGNIPYIPKFALGIWWSRYHTYSADEYYCLMEKFVNEGIYLSVATIDMDWHQSTNMYEYFKIKELNRNKIEYGFDINKPKWKWGWCGYSWNKELFPNPKEFLKNLHKMNLKVFLNIHPDDICWYEDKYNEMASKMNVSKLQPIKLDFTNENFINNYFDIMHHCLEEDGVDYWWIDDQKFFLSHYHYLDSKLNKTPLILSRFTGIGSQRYPLGFSGDSVISWDSLKFLPYFTSNATNIGYTWWSHDIGGFMYGIKDDELQLRYVQLGVFLPVLRLHCQSQEMQTKEPWTYDNGIGSLIKEHLQYRIRLIPYIYSGMYRNSIDGYGLIEPLYYYDKSNKAFNYQNEYFFNGQLLVAPIVKKSNNKKFSKVDVYLPKGNWYDIFTNDQYEGGKVNTMYRSLTSIPVLAHDGSIYILNNDALSNNLNPPKSLNIYIYKGNGEFVFYEDNLNNERVITTFSVEDIENTLYFSIMFVNKIKNRSFNLIFKNIKNYDIYTSSKVKIFNGDDLIIKIDKVNYDLVYEFQIKYESLTKLDVLKRQAQYVILRMQGNNDERNNFYESLKNAKSVDEYIELVNNAKIDKMYKKRLLESV